MVEAGAVSESDTVFEIGPGKGALTKYLLDTGANVLAIETDGDMVAILEKNYKLQIVNGKLELVHGDIRTSEKILKKLENYKLVANIPYYITGEIIRDFLSRKNQPTSMTLLVQREVALRVARDPKESILSIAVKIFGDPRYVDTVPAGAFSPPPKVDSAILTIQNISKKRLGEINEKHFFNVLKTGFAARRKMLRGNLSKKWPLKAVESALIEAGIPRNARGEDVHLECWINLSKALGSKIFEI